MFNFLFKQAVQIEKYALPPFITFILKNKHYKLRSNSTGKPVLTIYLGKRNILCSNKFANHCY